MCYTCNNISLISKSETNHKILLFLSFSKCRFPLLCFFPEKLRLFGKFNLIDITYLVLALKFSFQEGRHALESSQVLQSLS